MNSNQQATTIVSKVIRKKQQVTIEHTLEPIDEEIHQYSHRNHVIKIKNVQKTMTIN